MTPEAADRARMRRAFLSGALVTLALIALGVGLGVGAGALLFYLAPDYFAPVSP